MTAGVNYSETRNSLHHLAHTKTDYDDGNRNRSPAEEEPDSAVLEGIITIRRAARALGVSHRLRAADIYHRRHFVGGARRPAVEAIGRLS